ncbi:GNAT family N-acetyltransferase [Actinophytocola sp.]|uniref:GNAT family N-acetyltransferase n=1 Tax=Actinophytocola sp. TaxID=1872138 RepID=UPI0039C8781E
MSSPGEWSRRVGRSAIRRGRGEWAAVGYVCVRHKSECDFIEEIALLPEARGRGIGTRPPWRILRAARRRPRCSGPGLVYSSTIPRRPAMLASGSKSCGSRIRACRFSGPRARCAADGAREHAQSAPRRLARPDQEHAVPLSH